MTLDSLPLFLAVVPCRAKEFFPRRQYSAQAVAIKSIGDAHSGVIELASRRPTRMLRLHRIRSRPGSVGQWGTQQAVSAERGMTRLRSWRRSQAGSLTRTSICRRSRGGRQAALALNGFPVVLCGKTDTPPASKALSCVRFRRRSSEPVTDWPVSQFAPFESG